MDDRRICRECGDGLDCAIADVDSRYCQACTGYLEREVPVTLQFRDLRTLHELVVSRAVTIEASEEACCLGLGSSQFRRPANVLRLALAQAEVKA